MISAFLQHEIVRSDAVGIGKASVGAVVLAPLLCDGDKDRDFRCTSYITSHRTIIRASRTAFATVALDAHDENDTSTVLIQ